MFKIRYDPSFYFMCLLSIFGGYYTEWLIYLLTIMIHESGHLLMAFLFKWKLSDLKFFGFGGIMTYERELNQTKNSDLLISSGGIIANLLVLLIIRNVPSMYFD